MWIKAVLLLTVVTAAASTSKPNNNSNKFDKQQFNIDLNAIFAPFVDSQCKAALNPGTGAHECLQGTELCKDILLIDTAPSDPFSLLPLASADPNQLCACIAQVDYCTSTVGASECSSSGDYCANFQQTSVNLVPLLTAVGQTAPSCDAILGATCVRSNPFEALCGSNQVMCYKSFSELATLADTELTASNLCKDSCADCPNSGPLPASSKPNFRMCGPQLMVGCSDDEQCSEGTYCRFNQCAPFSEINEQCSPSTQLRCAAPLTCYIRNNPIPTPGAGGVCQLPGYCEIDRDCDSGHYCHALVNFCTPFRLADESCSPSTNQRCAPSLQCIMPPNAQPGASGTCKSETTGGCQQHTDCTPETYCWNGECTPYGQFGEPCQTSTPPGTQRLCTSGLVCLVNGPPGSSGTCRPEDWCEATSDCPPGNYCKGLQCVDYAKEGDSCDGSLPPGFQTLCAPGLSCVLPPTDGLPIVGGSGICQGSSNEDMVRVVELFGQLSEPGSCEEFSEVREQLLRAFGQALSMISITLPVGTFTAVEILLCAHHVAASPEAKIKAQQAIPPSIATYQFTARWVIPFVAGDTSATQLESTLNSPLAASQLEQNFGIVVNRVDVTSGDIDTVQLCSDPNKEFRSCGSACPPKCSDNGPIACPAVCKPGCFCKDPTHVLDENDKCISRTLCPAHNNPCQFDVCPPGQRCHAEKYNPPIVCVAPPCDQYYAVCVPEEDPCMNHHCDIGEMCIKRKYNPPIQCLVPPCDEYYPQCVPDGGGVCSNGAAEDAMFNCLPERCLFMFEEEGRPDIRGRERETCNCFREAAQCFRRHSCFDRYMCEDMGDTVEGWFRDSGFYCRPSCTRDDQCTGGSGSRGTVNININNVVNGRRGENN